MSYTIRQITNESEWEAFNKRMPFSVFVQSPTYGKFYQHLGEKYFILGAYDGDTLVGGSLVVSTHARRGDFLYLPYGPILDFSNSALVETFFSYLRDYGKKEGYDFIRTSPLVDEDIAVQGILKRNGFRSAPMHVLAEHSWLLDVQKSEDELLRDMKKNHRNLIRRCEREGVSVRIKGEDGVETLHTLLDETAKRLNFHRFSRQYIDEEFALFHAKDEACIFEATLPRGEVDASAIIMFYGNMAVYRHSASLNLNKKLPSSYLIQWEVIKEAKRRGIQWYNFWGVEPVGAPKTHPFAGIGHFKRGFGGMQRDLVHCHDLPLTAKYWLNWLVETIRRYRRGF